MNSTPTLSLPHLARRPAQAQEAPPLLVLLHGYGSNEQDLFGLAPYLDERLLIVSARAPLTLMPGGYAWFHLDIDERGVRLDPRQFVRQAALVADFVAEACAAYGADPQRVLLGGFSQGAMISAAVLLSRPELLAGALLMSGAMLPEVLPLLQPPGFDPQPLAGKPVLAVHGTYDPVLPIALGRATRATLERLPLALTYREYPMAHEVSLESLRDVAAWVKAAVDA